MRKRIVANCKVYSGWGLNFLSEDQIERIHSATVVIEAANHFIPIDILSMVMAGASSPISLSGALVTTNAEVLAGVVLTQLTNPGAPVWYGCSSTTFDMRRGTATVGAPEMAMLNTAAAELSNFYGIPSYVAGG